MVNRHGCAWQGVKLAKKFVRVFPYDIMKNPNEFSGQSNYHGTYKDLVLTVIIKHYLLKYQRRTAGCWASNKAGSKENHGGEPTLGALSPKEPVFTSRQSYLQNPLSQPASTVK